MNMKLTIVMLILMLSHELCDAKTALRRKPKVYNALITTDEDLVQSRAYPVIQPTLHESGIAHYPFNPYSPYGVYNSHVVGLPETIAPALSSKEQLSYPLPAPQVPPQIVQKPLWLQPLAGYPLPQNPPTAPAAEKPHANFLPPTGLEEQPQPTAQLATIQTHPPELTKDPNQPAKMPLEQLPIPLNQYGLPPALIPLRQPQPIQPQPQLYPSPNGLQSFHLHPYRFNPIPPVYYNSLRRYREQFLPPYGYLPSGPHFPLSNTIPTDEIYPQPSGQPIPTPRTPAPPTPPPTTPVTIPEEITESVMSFSEPLTSEPAFENIKNGSKSQDSSVPDVPPPPIPSGAKSKQS